MYTAVRRIASEVTLLGGFAQPTQGLHVAIEQIVRAAPFRHFKTPGGRVMSAAQSNCGPWGWLSDSRGYRYESLDPLTGAAWPAMPESFMYLARCAAAAAGYANFIPDACLMNYYGPTAQMGTHRDADELDFTQPIVSVSLGQSATFLWYGMRRSGAAVRVRLEDGDVLVWGGAARLGYHAVQKPLTGGDRYNLTFRRAR